MFVTEILNKPMRLTEGVNDKYIFKAVFVIGSPGSGKSTVATKFFGHLGFKKVDPDIVGEYLSKKYDMTLNREDWKTNDLIHMDLLTEKKLGLYIRGRLPLIIDGTGRNKDVIRERFIQLNKLGYECALIFVDTDVNVAIKRNLQRSRKVPIDYLELTAKESRKNLPYYKSLFKDNFFVLENTSDGFPTHTVKQLAKDINIFLRRPVQNLQAIKWRERMTGETYGERV